MTFLARLAAWVEKTNKSNNCPSYKKTTKKKADAELAARTKAAIVIQRCFRKYLADKRAAAQVVHPFLDRYISQCSTRRRVKKQPTQPLFSHVLQHAHQEHARDGDVRDREAGLGLVRSGTRGVFPVGCFPRVHYGQGREGFSPWGVSPRISSSVAISSRRKPCPVR